MVSDWEWYLSIESWEHVPSCTALHDLVGHAGIAAGRGSYRRLDRTVGHVGVGTGVEVVGHLGIEFVSGLRLGSASVSATLCLLGLGNLLVGCGLGGRLGGRLAT